MLRSRRKRRLAGFMAASFALSLLAAAHHRATVVHGYCSDHGRQIHLQHRHHQPGDEPPEPGLPVVEHDRHVAGEHDCAHLAFLTKPCSVRRAALEPGVTRLTPREPARQLTPPLSGIPLLLLSPKHSPPV